MGIVLINGQEVEIGDDERLNGIQAARRAGVEIPHYCWHPGLTVVASCRMCLVETGNKDRETGEVRMMPKLVPACQTPARDGTVFVTQSEKVEHARALVEECLLIDHPIDCPICDKAGECYLQDYHFKYGQDQRRADLLPFHSRKRDMGPTVALFVDRCVMCSRCVRFTREISGTGELMVVDRGSREEIDVFPGYPLENKLSGNVVDICPVGALGDKDFLYKQRVWYMDNRPGVCTGCSTGCSIWIDENQDRVWRLRPRENPQVNEWWMCDEGRYGFHYANSESRLVGPWRKEGSDFQPADWIALLGELRDKLKTSGPTAAVISPHATVEEAYLLAQAVRSGNPDALLALGPVPVEGEDETFKNGFTIRAEKCPNRKGVNEVLKHFGNFKTFDELLGTLEPEAYELLWVLGGYPQNTWIDEETAKQFDGAAKLLVVQDFFASWLSEHAEYVLPATTFAEKDGSFVNHADHLQSVRWSVRPPGGVRSEAGVFRYLLGQKGMFKAAEVLEEITREIVYFSAAAEGVPETGINLKSNQLAGV